MDNKKIWEDQYDQDSRTALLDVMDKKQLERADFYMTEYNTLKAEVEPVTQEWQEIEELYHGDRDDIDAKDDTCPNAFVNIILPQVEGQVAAMTEQNITANFKGVGVSDQSFARTANIIMRQVFKHNKIKQKVKRAGRRYTMFGNAAMVYGWDDEAFDGMGMPTIETPFPGHILVDGKIKNMEDYQKADFIIHVKGHMSIMWARKVYGDKIADAITMGNNDSAFDSEASGDDDKSFTLLHIWTRNNEQGNLQRIDMSLCGVILEESDPKEPFYTYVRNQYPITFAGLYPREGQFWRFGDGKLLEPLQKLINKIFDEIVLAVRFAAQSRTFVDPVAQMNPDDYDKDPYHPIMCKNPQTSIYSVPGKGIDVVIFNLINLLFQKAQEMTRFSALMSGNSTGEDMTATQAGIQMQQGNTGINDKRTDISAMLEDAAPYCLGLCMQFWPAAVALRVSDNEEDFEWVDARQLTAIPKMVPASAEFENEYKKRNPKSKKKPQWMQHIMEDGTPATKIVALDADVSIGEGLPTNKVALYNIILSLAQMQLIDQMGQPRPLMYYEQVKTQVEDLLGIKIDNITPQAMAPQVAGALGLNPQMAGMPNVPNMPAGGSLRPINQDANIPGANAGGQMKGGVR